MMKLIDGIKFIDVDDKAMGVSTGDAAKTYQGIIKLNKTGYRIWTYFEKGLSFEEVAEQLCKDYQDLTYDKSLNVVKEFADKLIEKGILIAD